MSSLLFVRRDGGRRRRLGRRRHGGADRRQAPAQAQEAGKHPVVGAALTIADLTLASSLMYARQTEVPVSEFPNIQTWFARITEMDAWNKTAP